MASKDKESTGADSNGDGAPDKSKRPSRVIDLEAAEVEIDDESDSGSEHESDENSDTPGHAAEADEGPAKTVPATPPQRTKPSDIKGFVTHLAAGLAGGLIGVVGAGIALDRLPLNAPGGGQQESSRDIQKLAQRLDALDAAVAGQAKSASRAVPEAVADAMRALNRFEARLGAIESTPKGAAADLAPLTARLEKLEAAFQALPAPGAENAPDGAAVSPELSEKIADISRNLEQRTAALSAEIEALKSALEARPAAQGEGNGDQIGVLETRLKTLDGKIAKLAARPLAPVMQIPSGGNGAAVTLAVEILRRTIDRGEPYGRQLKALQEAAPAGLDVSALSAHADAGIQTDGALLAALKPALRAAREAAARPDDDTFLGRLVSNARSVVRVRRIGQAEGSDAAAVLARMEAHMKAGDLRGVLKEADGLSGPARTSLQSWLDMAQAKRAVRMALAEIERGLLAGLRSGAAAAKSR